jgi:hypothetical protein
MRRVEENEVTPALHTDPALTRKSVPVIREVLGADRVTERPPTLGGEGFSRYSRGRASRPLLVGNFPGGARRRGG